MTSNLLFYCSGWVQTVWVYQKGPYCIMKAVVRASQTMKREHDAWVGIVKKTGTVITGHCTCMAG